MIHKSIGSSPLTDLLASEFTCNKCGHCCSIGGDMNLSQSDIDRIAAYLGCSPEDHSRIPIAPSYSEPGKFMLTITRPCFFLDKSDLTCTIYEARPEACRQYPWKLLKKRGCTMIDVILCNAARAQLEDYIRSSRVRPAIRSED